MQVGLADVEGTMLLRTYGCSGSFIQIRTFLCTAFAFLAFHLCHSIFVGSGLNSMYMHARVFIGIGAILYAAPCKNFRAVLVPGST